MFTLLWMFKIRWFFSLRIVQTQYNFLFYLRSHLINYSTWKWTINRQRMCNATFFAFMLSTKLAEFHRKSVSKDRGEWNTSEHKVISPDCKLSTIFSGCMKIIDWWDNSVPRLMHAEYWVIKIGLYRLESLRLLLASSLCERLLVQQEKLKTTYGQDLWIIVSVQQRCPL